MPCRLISYTALATILALAALTTAGCRRFAPAAEYDSFGGTLSGRTPENGEITVLVTRGQKHYHEKDFAVCVVTRAAEIYLNDAWARVEDLQNGDALEIIGYHEPGTLPRRFVVSAMYARRPEPPPPLPDFIPPRPAQENR